MIAVRTPKYAWVVHDDDTDEVTVMAFANSPEEAEPLWAAADKNGPRGNLLLWEVADMKIGFVGINPRRGRTAVESFSDAAVLALARVAWDREGEAAEMPSGYGYHWDEIDAETQNMVAEGIRAVLVELERQGRLL